MEGTHTVRIELTSGGTTRFDYISYDLKPSSGIDPDHAEPTTWGSIKALYR
jgi:hypothetical protein